MPNTHLGNELADKLAEGATNIQDTLLQRCFLMPKSVLKKSLKLSSI